MEYLEGFTLRELLKDFCKSFMPLEIGVFAAISMIECVQECHEIGYVHQDMKDTNIMVDVSSERGGADEVNRLRFRKGI